MYWSISYYLLSFSKQLVPLTFLVWLSSLQLCHVRLSIRFSHTPNFNVCLAQYILCKQLSEYTSKMVVSASIQSSSEISYERKGKGLCLIPYRWTYAAGHVRCWNSPGGFWILALSLLCQRLTRKLRKPYLRYRVWCGMVRIGSILPTTSLVSYLVVFPRNLPALSLKMDSLSCVMRYVQRSAFKGKK